MPTQPENIKIQKVYLTDAKSQSQIGIIVESTNFNEELKLAELTELPMDMFSRPVSSALVEVK